MQAKRLIRRKCEAFLCTVKDMQKETPNHKDISVVCDFPDVFPEELPGLPPSREVEFSIDLVLGYRSHTFCNSVTNSISRRLRSLKTLGIRPNQKPSHPAFGLQKPAFGSRLSALVFGVRTNQVVFNFL
ncbi:unnamed protein product [Cuscuta campestris]|uniref:Reverse transcriptase domain-containing protein n=1 Tax=Cuscuta campestris TaxID=132261 RepID=A0A484LS15_9ASTE|nr:unnamed protein product [Cuscuta campestris]